MGIAPSKTELFLPSDTIRLCNPDRCWCNGRHQNRSSKYVYVERGGDGRERYQDPVDMMGDFLMGGGGGAGMPWKNPGEWTVRDYERLGEVLNEWQMRERGRRRGGSSTGHPPASGGGMGMYGPSPWDAAGGGGGSSGRRRRTHPSWNEFERMQETVEEKFRNMAGEYQRHMSERDSLLFGSSQDHRREQYRNNMLKTLQEILPQLSQMMAQQQMGGGGMGMNGMPGMQNGMAGGVPPGMGGMGAPGMPGMQGGGMGMQGMGMNPMMNPMAGGMGGGGGGMGQMNMPGGGMNDFGGGGGFGRRARGRRERPFREDFEEDFGAFGGGGGGGGRAGRPFRRGRKGGWGDDDEDMLGDGGISPRRPQGGPRRPRRPEGGGDFDDGGGFAGGYPAFGHQDDDPFRTAPPIPPHHAHFHTAQPGLSRQPGMGFPDPERTNIPDRDLHPMAPPLRRTSPTPPGLSGYAPQTWAPAAHGRPLDPEIRPASASRARDWYTGGAPTRPAFDPTGPSMFPPGAVGETGPATMRPDPMRREAGFQPEARLSRPRNEETDRREPEAGAVPTKRDLL